MYLNDLVNIPIQLLIPDRLSIQTFGFKPLKSLLVNRDDVMSTEPNNFNHIHYNVFARVLM